MAKPNEIQLLHAPSAAHLNILYEDRSVLAVDKPAGWMLVPYTWQKTSWNLQAAIDSSINAGDFWARARNLKYLRHVHRLDAETSGVLLFAKSQGALLSIGRLFERRQVQKRYLAVVAGQVREGAWSCRLKLAPDPQAIGRMKVDAKNGKAAETHFRVLQRRGNLSLIEARPVTGRTHQIRVHLVESAQPVLGDALYGPPAESTAPRRARPAPLALRAIELGYLDPFQRQRIRIAAPADRFLAEYGFAQPLEPARQAARAEGKPLS